MAIVCPKCGAENAETEYFCTACHAHIRSAFGAPVAISASQATSIFGSPAAQPTAQTEVAESPEPTGEVHTDSDALAVIEEPPANGAHATVEAETAEPPRASDESATQAEHSLTLVTDGTWIEWELRDASPETKAAAKSSETHSEITASVGAPTPPRTDAERIHRALAALPSDPFFGPLYNSLRKSAAPYVKLPSAEELAPQNSEAVPNTSGQGPQAVLPAETRAWSWAGFIPCGVFGFAINLPLLGILGLLALLTGRFGFFVLWPLYMLIVGARGRELAWRKVKYGSVAQFVTTHNAWDAVGKICVVVDIMIYLIFLSVFAVLDSAS